MSHKAFASVVAIIDQADRAGAERLGAAAEVRARAPLWLPLAGAHPSWQEPKGGAHPAALSPLLPARGPRFRPVLLHRSSPLAGPSTPGRRWAPAAPAPHHRGGARPLHRHSFHIHGASPPRRIKSAHPRRTSRRTPWSLALELLPNGLTACALLQVAASSGISVVCKKSIQHNDPHRRLRRIQRRRRCARPSSTSSSARRRRAPDPSSSPACRSTACASTAP